MKLGYARVSTASQTTEQQCDALRKAGCERIFVETASGAKEDRLNWRGSWTLSVRAMSGSWTASPTASGI